MSILPSLTFGSYGPSHQRGQALLPLPRHLIGVARPPAALGKLLPLLHVRRGDLDLALVEQHVVHEARVAFPYDGPVADDVVLLLEGRCLEDLAPVGRVVFHLKLRT